MAEMRFQGVVRSYSVGDDGRIHLGIDENDPSERARYYVHDMVKDFNPSHPKFGYGAKDTPCNIKPGFASYRLVLDEKEARNITHGSIVDVTLEVYHVRKVRFYQRRWTAIPELQYELVSVRPVTGAAERPAKAS